MAGRTGFEPATGFTQHSLSRRAHSATLAPPRIQLEGFKLPTAQLVLNKPSNIWTFYHAILSGGVGFEPTLACTKHVFKTCTFSRSVIPPEVPLFFGSGGDFTIRLRRGDRLCSLLYFANTLVLNSSISFVKSNQNYCSRQEAV